MNKKICKVIDGGPYHDYFQLLNTIYNINVPVYYTQNMLNTFHP